MILSDVTVEYKDKVGVITVINGDFTGTKFSYGKVWFPNEDEPVLAFEYDILSETYWLPERADAFKQEAGQLLEAMLRKQIEDGDLVFKGGT